MKPLAKYLTLLSCGLLLSNMAFAQYFAFIFADNKGRGMSSIYLYLKCDNIEMPIGELTTGKQMLYSEAFDHGCKGGDRVRVGIAKAADTPVAYGFCPTLPYHQGATAATFKIKNPSLDPVVITCDVR